MSLSKLDSFIPCIYNILDPTNTIVIGHLNLLLQVSINDDNLISREDYNLSSSPEFGRGPHSVNFKPFVSVTIVGTGSVSTIKF